MEGAAFGFLIATTAGLLLAALTFLLARKSGLQPAQAKLIETLKENADALDKQVKLLKSELDEQRDRRVQLERKVARLEAVIIEIVAENSDLRQKLGMPPRRNATAVTEP